jgi:hypothetical protein
MAKKRSIPRRRRSRPARFRQDPTPWPGLVGAPFVLLCNLGVITADDNAKTDGPIPPKAVSTVQTLIRRRYEFPDLALDKERGVGLSLIGQFFHVDDYRELGMARLHRDYMLAILEGEAPPFLDLGDLQLRQSTVSDPQSMAQGKESGVAVWYKQRLLAFYFVGERDRIKRLAQEPPGEELLRHIVAVLAQALDLSEQLGIFIHPAFVPAARMLQVSRQNALEWAQAMEVSLAAGDLDSISVMAHRVLRTSSGSDRVSASVLPTSVEITVPRQRLEKEQLFACF